MVTATGSKRSSADSDLLLCHVRLWQTSRLKFGCVSVCEHSEIKFALHNTHVTPHPPLSRSPFSHWRRLIVTSVSAQTKFTPALHFQRACRQCVHESARLSRALCSHAWYSKNCGERQNHRLSLCHLPHVLATHYFLRLTRARRGGLEGGRRESSLLTFGTFGHAKVR